MVMRCEPSRFSTETMEPTLSIRPVNMNSE